MKLNVKAKLIADVRARFGDKAEDVIEYLYDMGTLDDFRARPHVMKCEAIDRLLNTTTSESQIYEDVGYEYGCDRTLVYRTVTNAHRA